MPDPAGWNPWLPARLAERPIDNATPRAESLDGCRRQPHRLPLGKVQQMAERPTAIIVEDDALARVHFEMYCEFAGLNVLGVTGDPDEAERLITNCRPDFVLMDVRLEADRDGVDLAILAHERSPESKVIFVTGSNEARTMERIYQDHPHDVLIKPIVLEDIVRATIN